MTSERDDALLAFVRGFAESHGHAPTYREIAEAMDMKSTQTVSAALHRLGKAGLVEWEPGHSRTLRLIR